MRRNLVWGLVALAVLIGGANVSRGQLGEEIANEIKSGAPVLGADLGAAIPISKFQQSANPGGSLAPFVGYQIGHNFCIMPIVQSQFIGFTTTDGFGSQTPSLISLSGGARFSLYDENTEIYFGAQGGYYWHTSGPLDDHSGNGFDINGGLNYEFWRGTGLGIFARYDQANTAPFPNADSDTTQYLTAGLEVRHRFLPPPPAPPPPPAVAAAPPPPPPPPVKKKIVLRGVNFDFNKYNIRPDAVPILDEAAKTLKDAGDVTVAVNGYTDGIGSDGYNLRLSDRRANAVKDYLERRGVAASRMTVRGFGKADPVASNATPEGRAQNRRVELIVNNQ